ncbi:hypothetical protein IB286_02315 [Spongiibacter sp. KMU-158]|uniref:HemY N-terminal domain-containing protein n=1 Tax=Spongiibacter pelagi TaxID=2760804 RepID=A0A927GUY5_9GAMM|nr:heme biosynthesis HemY N-terminal domain-containing protein [Spongiibacter pelagi]MBD2857825.1 hypothetical protein [Spongiibacter pelagi]
MRVFFIALIGLVVALLISAGMQRDAGYILIAFGQTTVEMSLWIGAAVLLLFIGVLVLIFIALRRTGHLKDKLGSFRSDRRQRKIQQQTFKGLLAYTEGRWSKARSLLSASAEQAEQPFLHHVLAARASQQLAEPKTCRQHLLQAAKAGSGAKLAAAIVEAELLLKSGNAKEARAVLANTGALTTPAVQTLMVEVLRELQDWSALRELLVELRKAKLMSPAALDRIEQDAIQGDLHKLILAGDGAALLSWWASLPTRWQQLPELLVDYIAGLLALDRKDEARRCAEAGLKKQWNVELLRLFVRLAEVDAKQPLKLAESWLSKHPNDGELLLGLGRLCLKNQLWGKARDYFEAAFQVAPTGESALELSRLLSALGEDDLSRQYVLQALALQGQGLPDLPQPKK